MPTDSDMIDTCSSATAKIRRLLHRYYTSAESDAAMTEFYSNRVDLFFLLLNEEVLLFGKYYKDHATYCHLSRCDSLIEFLDGSL